MTGSGDAPGHLNELSSDIDTLSDNLLETYTNLLHLERVLRCQHDSADGPAAAPDQRWRRRRRSFQLAAVGDGVSEQSGPPAADSVHTDTGTTRLERRVTELEADVRRIDEEKEEIRIKYTAVLKRLRRLQVSSSENWEIKSPTSASGCNRSSEVRRWPASVGRRSAAQSASESGGSGAVSRPSTASTLPPAGVNSTDTLPPAGVNSTDTLPPAGVNSSDTLPPAGVNSSDTLPPRAATTNGTHLGDGPESPPPPAPGDGPESPPPPAPGDGRLWGVTTGLQSVAETAAETRDSPGAGGWRPRGAGVPRGGSPLENVAGTDGSRASCGGGVSGSPVQLRSSRMDSEDRAAVSVDPTIIETHPVQETAGVTSPFLPSESDSDFPAGVSSCDREDHSCTVSSVHPGIDPAQSGIGSSHSIPAGVGRPALPGSRASSRCANNPPLAFSRSTSNPLQSARDYSKFKDSFSEPATGRSRWSVSESAQAGDGSRQAVEDQIDFPRHSGTDFSPTRRPGTESGGGAASSTERPAGSPVLYTCSSASKSNQSNSGLEDHPGPSSPPRHHPPRAASPEEGSAPPGHGGDRGDTYNGAGGATCGSFAAWPADGGMGGSPSLLSSLVLFAGPSSPSGGVKSLCEVADSATQTETERDDTETVAALEATIRRKDSVIESMKTSLAKVETQLVTTQQQLQTIETDVLQRLAGAEQTWRRKRRQLQLDLAGERAMSQTLHAVEVDLGEQLRRCRRRCAELEASLADRSGRGLAVGRDSETRRRRRSRRLAVLCHQLAEHVGRLLAAQTRLTGELLSTLQQLFGLFTAQSPAVPSPCQEATLATLPLWLPWLAAEVRLACRDRQQRHLPPVSPPEALPSPPPGGAPPYLSALVSQVWEDIERLRRLDLDEPAGQGEVEEASPRTGDSLE